MPRLVLELTTRCDLACHHCFDRRHGGHEDMPLALIQRILASARDHGVRQIDLTGGEPTLHPRFADVVASIVSAGYPLGLVTNGQRLAAVLPTLLAHRERLGAITMSLDGATPATHDALRGEGAFQGVMRAITLCVMHELPYTLNCLISPLNRHELAEIADLAQGLGALGLRFGYLLHHPAATDLALSPEACRAAQRETDALADRHAMPVLQSANRWCADLAPCAPLRHESLGVDATGYLAACCDLLSYRPNGAPPPLGGDLNVVPFDIAVERAHQAMDYVLRAKEARHASAIWRDTDHVACWFCCQQLGLVDWIRACPEHPWHGALWPVKKQAPC